MGKSIGAGSLSIWTHQLKNIKIIDKYSDKSTSYTGSAVTFGAGWQTADIYNTLNAVGKVIVGGECAVGSPRSTCICPTYILTNNRAWDSPAATFRAEAMDRCPLFTGWVPTMFFNIPSSLQMENLSLPML